MQKVIKIGLLGSGTVGSGVIGPVADNVFDGLPQQFSAADHRGRFLGQYPHLTPIGAAFKMHIGNNVGQQFLQGYLPVSFLALNAKYGLMPGGNVPSGPNLITKDKANGLVLSY